MRNCTIAGLFFLLTITIMPAISLAEYEPAGHRWTIGYEGGITLRRFLGSKWEIYMGGGPDDFKSNRDDVSYRYPHEDGPTDSEKNYNSHKSESGFVNIGLGRKLVQENRFWLTAFINLSYNWDNYQDTNERDYDNSDRFRQTESVGHRMYTALSLGLRPSYDITSRIVLMADFKIYYQNLTWTEDYREDDFNGEEWEIYKYRRSGNSDNVRVTGINSISSIGFMFRF